MNNKHKKSDTVSRAFLQRKQPSGFSLVEMMVAMGMFLVIAGGAVSLVGKHVQLYNPSQNQTQINMTMRSAIAQMQMDVVNAGSGYYPGANMPFWPVGLTIVPATTANCNATRNYVATCFDQLTVLTSDDPSVTSMPAAAPNADELGTQPVDTTAGGSMYLTFPDNPTLATLTARAAAFNAGDEILLVQSGTATPLMAPIILTANGVVGPLGKTVKLAYGAFNPVTAASGFDTLKIFDNADRGSFGSAFGAAAPNRKDYAIKLIPTFYKVDTTVANNPRLIRQVGFLGNPEVVAEQIIGFQVSGWSSLLGGYSSTPANAPAGVPPGYNNDWTSIRSLRVVLTVRTPPSNDPAHASSNSYDFGPYQVQGTSVVINPRNLSMDN